MPLSIDVSVDSLSLSEKAYNILKEQIICGNLAPGEKLDIQELARYLHISRTPVKEAIHRLFLQGLVTIHSRKGTFVSIWDSKKVQDLFDFRLMLEIGSAERALALGGAPDIEKMHHVLQLAGSLFCRAGEFDYGEFTSLDQQFHTLIVEGARNSQLALAYDSLNAHVQVMRVYWGRAQNRAQQSQDEHLEIYEALRKGNLERVKRSLTEHITKTRDDVLRILPSLNPDGCNATSTEGPGTMLNTGSAGSNSG